MGFHPSLWDIPFQGKGLLKTNQSQKFGFTLRSGDFNPRRLSYESMKSLGFNIISNSEVRNEIIKLYDNDYVNSGKGDEFLRDGGSLT